jgi:hypothetical protein
MKKSKMAKDPYSLVRKEHQNLSALATEKAKAIVSVEALKDGISFYRTLKGKEDRWLGFIGQAVSDAYTAHKSIKAVEKELAQPLERARLEILKPAIRDYMVAYRKERHQKEEDLRNETGMELILPDGAKVEGVFLRMEYKVETTDIKELCRAVADGKVPEGYVIPNTKLLNDMARNLKTALCIPGVKVIETPDVTIRTIGNGGENHE